MSQERQIKNNIIKKPWIQPLLEFFKTIKAYNDKIETIREALFLNEKFNPNELFNYLDFQKNGFLTSKNIINYLNETNTKYYEQYVRVIIHNYDKDGDFTLNLKEFLNMVLPIKKRFIKEKILKNEKENTADNSNGLPFEVKNLFNQLIKEELNLAESSFYAIKNIYGSKKFTTYEAFINIVKNESYITRKNLNIFLRENEYEFNEDEIYLLMFRIDNDNDNRISYIEFQDIFYPLKKLEGYSQKLDNEYDTKTDLINNDNLKDERSCEKNYELYSKLCEYDYNKYNNYLLRNNYLKNNYYIKDNYEYEDIKEKIFNVHDYQNFIKKINDSLGCDNNDNKDNNIDNKSEIINNKNDNELNNDITLQKKNELKNNNEDNKKEENNKENENIDFEKLDENKKDIINTDEIKKNSENDKEDFNNKKKIKNNNEIDNNDHAHIENNNNLEKDNNKVIEENNENINDNKKEDNKKIDKNEDNKNIDKKDDKDLRNNKNLKENEQKESQKDNKVNVNEEKIETITEEKNSQGFANTINEKKEDIKDNKLNYKKLKSQICSNFFILGKKNEIKELKLKNDTSIKNFIPIKENNYIYATERILNKSMKIYPLEENGNKRKMNFNTPSVNFKSKYLIDRENNPNELNSNIENKYNNINNENVNNFEERNYNENRNENFHSYITPKINRNQQSLFYFRNYPTIKTSVTEEIKPKNNQLLIKNEALLELLNDFIIQDIATENILEKLSICPDFNLINLFQSFLQFDFLSKKMVRWEDIYKTLTDMGLCLDKYDIVYIFSKFNKNIFKSKDTGFNYDEFCYMMVPKKFGKGKNLYKKENQKYFMGFSFKTKRIICSLFKQFIDSEKSNEKYRCELIGNENNMYKIYYCIENLFVSLKKRRKNGIDINDIYDFMKINGKKLCKFELELLMERFDKNKDNIIDFEEFYNEIRPKLKF